MEDGGMSDNVLLVGPTHNYVKGELQTAWAGTSKPVLSSLWHTGSWDPGLEGPLVQLLSKTGIFSPAPCSHAMDSPFSWASLSIPAEHPPGG